jgi:hypothetical protein
LQWIRTWMIDETYFDIFNPAFTPGRHSLDPRQLPESAFDSAEERQRVEDLIARYNQTLYFTPEISDGFAEIASERIGRAPVRFFLVLPLERIVSVWVTGFSTSNPTRRAVRILSVLPIIWGGVLGFVLWCRRVPLTILLTLIILTRTIFLGYHYAPETRYIVEAYPPLIAACGVTAAALWFYVRRRVAQRLSPSS